MSLTCSIDFLELNRAVWWNEVIFIFYLWLLLLIKSGWLLHSNNWSINALSLLKLKADGMIPWVTALISKLDYHRIWSWNALRFKVNDLILVTHKWCHSKDLDIKTLILKVYDRGDWVIEALRSCDLISYAERNLLFENWG